MPKSVRTSEYRKLLQELKKCQDEVALTQIDMANKLGKPQSYISKVLSGERRMDVLELMQICDILEVETAELLAKIKVKPGKKR